MKSMVSSILLSAIALLGLSQNVNANHQRRSRRYPSYEHNSLDVLNGINEGEYEQIYIHYHGCVWSEFEGGDCGGGGDGNDDAEWYMGKTQCYRANVAYSLYGIRADDKKRRKNDACQRRYFINTFFTNNGMEDFGDAVGLANGGDASSECAAQDNGEENADNGGDNANQNGARMNANAQSYTTYCNRSRKFVTAQFGGAYCTDTSNLQLLDSLDTLNNELDNVGCLLVYSNEANANDNANEDANEEEQEDGDENEDQEDEENGNDDGGRRLEDGNAQEENNGGNGGLWNLLAYSNVCSALEYPRGCPDPHGAKKRFDVNARSSNGFWKQFMWLDWLTLIFFFLAIVMLVLAYCTYKDRRKRSKAQKNSSTNKTARKSSRFGRSTSSKTKSTSQKTQNQASSTTTEVNRTASTNTQKSKKGLFRGMFRKNKDTNTSSG